MSRVESARETGDLIMEVLAIDLGATNIRFAQAEYHDAGGGQWHLGPVSRLAAADYASLGSAIESYIARVGTRPKACGVGVPGPVRDRTARITNLPWHIDARELEAILQAPVALMNDLEAHAHGALAQGNNGCTVLRSGRPDPMGNAAMIVPGTGLGEALMFRDPQSGTLVPKASEGAHASFSPVTDEDIELLQFLRSRQEHVSWERVVSGRDGLRNILEFLLETGRTSVDPERQSYLRELPDIGAVLLQDASKGHAYAMQVLERFTIYLGAEAGNLALKALATGGVYIGGGLCKRVFDMVSIEHFYRGFVAKGRFRAMLADIPIYRVDDPDVALVGAAVVAAQNLRTRVANN